MVYELGLPSLYVLCCTATPKADGVIQQVSKQVLDFIYVKIHDLGLGLNMVA